MTFYLYDYSKFPEVKIIFNNNQMTKAQSDLFFAEWLQIFSHKKNFFMIYDITQVETAPIYFIYKLVAFIKKIKKMKPIYLEKSVILINNSHMMKFLLKTAMTLTKPAADMYVYWKNKYEVIDIDNLNTLLLRDKSKFEYYSP
jgi:hypothetical protein